MKSIEQIVYTLVINGWGRYFICRLCGDGQKNAKLHEALRHIAKEMAQNAQIILCPHTIFCRFFLSLRFDNRNNGGLRY
jgi:aromatic ring-opening dioxygenase LigB subunit